MANNLIGSLDETMYFPRVLTASEILELYLSTQTKYHLCGTVTQDGIPVQRLVRVYRRDTGAFVSELTSDVTGKFDLRLKEIASSGKYFIVAFDDDIVPDLEPIARDRLEPIPVNVLMDSSAIFGCYADADITTS